MPFELIADKLTWPVLGLLVLLIVFPGLVAMRSYRLFAAAREMEWRSALPESSFWGTIIFFFTYLTWSLGNFCAFCAADFTRIPHDFLKKIADTSPADQPIGFFLLLVVLAVVIPRIWVWLRNCRFVSRRILRQEPTAWDYYFSKQRECFILVHLKSGQLIGGYYGERSYASTYPEKRSLFIEIVYEVDEDGRFVKSISSSDGMLLTEDDFNYLEFLNNQEGIENG